MVESADRVSAVRARHPSLPILAFLSIAVALVVLRLPSLIEPPTFNDEGTYSDIGWALDHGAVLYRDVWGHYTPGVYWLGAAINLVSTSVVAFHLVLSAAIALTAFAIWRFCRRYTSASIAWAASLAFVILSSLPTFEGDVLYVEAIGSVLAIWALVIVTRRAPVAGAPALTAGILAGAAMLFKPTFAADAVVVATAPAVIALASNRRPGRGETRALLWVVAGAAGVLAIAVVGLWLGGSLPGLIDVVTHQDEVYLQSASGGGGSSVAPGGGTGTILLLMTVSRIGVVLAAGSLITWLLARRQHVGASVAAWWLTWDLAAVVVSALGLAHYTQQLEPAACACAALAAARITRHIRLRVVVAAVATTVTGWVVCVVALLGPTAEASLAVPQQLSGFVTSITSPHVITHYLGSGWERILGVSTAKTYDAGFGPQPTLVRQTVALIDAHSRPGDRVFVWGRVPWAYSLSARLPAGRYTSLNSSYTLDHNAQTILIRELRAHPPAVLIEIDPLPAQVKAMLSELHYRRVASLANGEICWVAPRSA